MARAMETKRIAKAMKRSIGLMGLISIANEISDK
jgi:hypothetical protein